MPDRDPDQPDLNPARVYADPLLREIAAMVSYMDLHIGRHEIRQMTTRQKELWADLVDADCLLEALEDAAAPNPRRSVRWWRDTPRRPMNEEGHVHGEQVVCRSCGKAVEWDADMEKFWIPYRAGNPVQETFHCPWGEPHWALPDGADEPDPFAYVDEGGMRTPGADLASAYDQAAAGVARAALLDVIADPWHRERPWLTDDFAAVYEWAKQAVRPMRMTTGDRAGQIGSLRSYPALDHARAFLDGVRGARHERSARPDRSST